MHATRRYCSKPRVNLKHKSVTSGSTLRKYLLIVCFSLCYLNVKLRADSRIQTDQIRPSHHMDSFLFFFLETIYVGKLIKKSIWEITNALLHIDPIFVVCRYRFSNIL